MLKKTAVSLIVLLCSAGCATMSEEQLEVDLLQCEELSTPELRQDCRSELNASFDEKTHNRTKWGAALTGAVAGAALGIHSDKTDTETAFLAAAGALLFWQYADEIYTSSTVERLEEDIEYQDKQLIAQSEELSAIATQLASMSSDNSSDMEELTSKIDDIGEDVRVSSLTRRENADALNSLDNRLDKVAAILDKSVAATEFLTTAFKAPEADEDKLAEFISRNSGSSSPADDAKNKQIIKQVDGQLTKLEKRKDLYKEVQSSAVMLRAQINNMEIQFSCSEITC